MKYDPVRWKPVPSPRQFTVFQKESYFERTPEAVFEFCLEGKNFQAIFPDPITPTKDTTETRILPDHVYVFRHWMKGFLPVRWFVHIAEYVPNQEFVDLQLRGPFRYFRHVHRCIPEGTGTRYQDIVTYRTFLGSFIDRTLVRSQLEKIFEHRHRMMKKLLES